MRLSFAKPILLLLYKAWAIEDIEALETCPAEHAAGKSAIVIVE